MDIVAVTGYQVFRGVGAGPLTPLITLGNVTVYQNTGLTPSTSYTYTVRARDAAGNFSGQSAPPITATTQAPAPCAVIGTNPPVLTWHAVARATGYTSDVCIIHGPTYQQALRAWVDMPEVLTTTTSTRRLTSGATYYFAATAYDAASESVFSNEVCKEIA